MAIRPPPTARHLPPSNATTAKSGSISNNCECSQWVSNTVANFSALRSQLEQSQSRMTIQQRNVAVPPMKDRAAWHVFCLGKEEADGNIGGYFQYNDDDDEEEEDLFLDEVKVERDDDANDLADRLNGKAESNDLQMQHQQSDSDTKEQDHNESSVEPNSNTTTTTTTTTQTNTTTTYNPNHVPLNGYTPTISLLLQFDQVLTRHVFHHHVHFVCEWKSPLTYNRAAWIYALLARMEKPWHRQECSAVRRLLRECCLRRWELVLLPISSQLEDVNKDADNVGEETDATLTSAVTTHENHSTQHLNLNVAKKHPQDGDSKKWELLALLNTLIAITGLYYEQGSMVGGDGMLALFSVPKNNTKNNGEKNGVCK